jgi:hypothetical protein
VNFAASSMIYNSNYTDDDWIRFPILICSSSCLQWGQNYPKPHAFTSLPLQSSSKYISCPCSIPELCKILLPELLYELLFELVIPFVLIILMICILPPLIIVLVREFCLLKYKTTDPHTIILYVINYFRSLTWNISEGKILS